MCFLFRLTRSFFVTCVLQRSTIKLAWRSKEKHCRLRWIQTNAILLCWFVPHKFCSHCIQLCKLGHYCACELHPLKAARYLEFHRCIGRCQRYRLGKKMRAIVTFSWFKFASLVAELKRMKRGRLRMMEEGLASQISDFRSNFGDVDLEEVARSGRFVSLLTLHVALYRFLLLC